MLIAQKTEKTRARIGKFTEFSSKHTKRQETRKKAWNSLYAGQQQDSLFLD